METTTTAAAPSYGMKDRMGFRPTTQDVAHVAIIAEALRRRGAAFVSRTDCLREALRTAAGAMRGETKR